MTHKNEEMLEAWDWERGEPTGEAVPRSRAHMEGIPHEGVHLWVVRLHDGDAQLLFQKRASFKDSYPGCFDITVGGHVPFGLREEKIQKEAEEEIGIRPEMNDLVDLGYFRYQEHEEKGRFHREFQHVYLLRDDRGLDGYRFNDGEVEALCAVPLASLKALMAGDCNFEVEVFDGSRLSRRVVGRENFHPLLFADSMKEYMAVMLAAVSELVNGGEVRTRLS